VPKSDGSLSAVVVSGGKQYRVAPGDQILVDRLAAEPGSSLKLGRVLLLRDGSDIKIGVPGIEGLDVEIKVLAHRRGPRIESLRYKSKKRVRVHRGGRADLTAIEIIAVGGLTEPTGTEKKAATKQDTKPKAEKKKATPAKAASEAKAAVGDKPDVKAEAKTATRKAPKTTKETK
jgi:large subunit ribosomal protein L21